MLDLTTGEFRRSIVLDGRRRTVAALQILTDISIIILAIQLFVMLVFALVILYYVNRGIARVPRAMKLLAPLAQFRFRQASQVAEQTSQKIAEPIIAAESLASRVDRIRKRLF
jgi:hypothetical protein